MPDYKKTYLILFNAITDAIHILQKAQQDAESFIIEDDGPNLIVLLQEEKEDKKGKKTSYVTLDKY